jgi:hypothetical protein
MAFNEDLMRVLAYYTEIEYVISLGGDTGRYIHIYDDLKKKYFRYKCLYYWRNVWSYAWNK